MDGGGGGGVVGMPRNVNARCFLFKQNIVKRKQ